MAQIGFIGMGNMGYAFLKGLLKEYKGNDIVMTDINKKRFQKIAGETGAVALENDVLCAERAKYLILAVKPQNYNATLKRLKTRLTPDQIVISIAPGITIAALKESLGGDKRIVRAMPNTPALLGEGMTGVCYDEAQFDDEEKGVIQTIFESVGKLQLVDEKLMNAVTCISGSSPAYVYMFIEALADSGVKWGMPRDMAYRMAAQTVMGSAKMVLETEEHPGKLKDQVCSPGGTSITGVVILEEFGFRNAIIKATDACYAKCDNIQ